MGHQVDTVRASGADVFVFGKVWTGPKPFTKAGAVLYIWQGLEDIRNELAKDVGGIASTFRTRNGAVDRPRAVGFVFRHEMSADPAAERKRVTGGEAPAQKQTNGQEHVNGAKREAGCLVGDDRALKRYLVDAIRQNFGSSLTDRLSVIYGP
jgi:hypothetical protein